ASSVPQADGIRAIRDPVLFDGAHELGAWIWGVSPCRSACRVPVRAEILPDLVKLAGGQRIAVPALAAGIRVRQLHHDPFGALDAERACYGCMCRDRERIAECLARGCRKARPPGRRRPGSSGGARSRRTWRAPRLRRARPWTCSERLR